MNIKYNQAGKVGIYPQTLLAKGWITEYDAVWRCCDEGEKVGNSLLHVITLGITAATQFGWPEFAGCREKKKYYGVMTSPFYNGEELQGVEAFFFQ
jgi:hypothetical protein